MSFNATPTRNVTCLPCLIRLASLYKWPESECNNAAVAKHCNWVRWQVSTSQFNILTIFPRFMPKARAPSMPGAAQWSLKMCLNMQIVRFAHYSICFIVGPNNVDTTRYLQRARLDYY